MSILWRSLETLWLCPSHNRFRRLPALKEMFSNNDVKLRFFPLAAMSPDQYSLPSRDPRFAASENFTAVTNIEAIPVDAVVVARMSKVVPGVLAVWTEG
ncbi:hypothetical protein BC777_0584 [Yoonia maricola]|uniref:Uncharacterized protein n=1 Tax=Yoonia maricola TaxID=420999 RepID=A0A2M8WLD9_9RHOB|nr:hypothetical protein BC777_0584 [Yoonia maricola]